MIPKILLKVLWIWSILGLGGQIFEMCWFYMGIAQIALETPPPLPHLCQTGMWEIVTQTILVSPHPLRAMPIYMERTHGASLIKYQISDVISDHFLILWFQKDSLDTEGRGS